jgi:hypothetical protein
VGVRRGTRSRRSEGVSSQVGTSSRRGRSSQLDVGGEKNMTCHIFGVGGHMAVDFPKGAISDLIYSM